MKFSTIKMYLNTHSWLFKYEMLFHFRTVSCHIYHPLEWKNSRKQNFTLQKFVHASFLSSTSYILIIRIKAVAHDWVTSIDYNWNITIWTKLWHWYITSFIKGCYRLYFVCCLPPSLWLSLFLFPLSPSVRCNYVTFRRILVGAKWVEQGAGFTA